MEGKRMNIDCLIVGPFMENCFLVSKESGEAIIIDPGDDEETIISLIKKKNLNPLAILATHAHIDHVGAVNRLKKDYGIPFYLNAADLKLLSSLNEQASMVGFSFGEIPSVDNFLKEDSALEIGGFQIEVICTPGHTQGGTCYKFGNFIFTGDTLFHGSIGRTDLPGGNYNQIMSSIMKKLVPLSGNTIVHCGHGENTTIENEKKSNPFILDPERYRGIL